MVKSFLSRIPGLSKKQPEAIPAPDLARISGAGKPDASPKRRRPAARTDTVDVTVWLSADLDRLSKTWETLVQSPSDNPALIAFNQAIHNLYGASGAYGGGALTRLSGSLQGLMKRSTDTQTDAALINLHVQACRACALDSNEDIANAVCDALEAQVGLASDASV